MPVLNTILSRMLDLIFPARCAGCGRGGSYLCAVCLSNSPIAERETERWVFSLFDYRHPAIKKALWLLKYKNKTGLAASFAEALSGKIQEELADMAVMENFLDPILIPIPLSRKRHKERGYNQAELICREILRLSKINHLSPPSAPLSLTRRGVGGEVFTLINNILIKPKETEHQARIENRRERLKNIVGSFAVQNAELVKNRNIILIDDITTTGATLSEARKVLRQAGARKIIAFTVAH